MRAVYTEELGLPESVSRARAAIRAAFIASAFAPIFLGVITHFSPGPTLLAAAVLFGLRLAVGGTLPIIMGIVTPRTLPPPGSACHALPTGIVTAC